MIVVSLFSWSGKFHVQMTQDVGLESNIGGSFSEPDTLLSQTSLDTNSESLNSQDNLKSNFEDIARSRIEPHSRDDDNLFFNQPKPILQAATDVSSVFFCGQYVSPRSSIQSQCLSFFSRSTKSSAIRDVAFSAANSIRSRCLAR